MCQQCVQRRQEYGQQVFRAFRSETNLAFSATSARCVSIRKFNSAMCWSSLARCRSIFCMLDPIRETPVKTIDYTGALIELIVRRTGRLHHSPQLQLPRRMVPGSSDFVNCFGCFPNADFPGGPRNGMAFSVKGTALSGTGWGPYRRLYTRIRSTSSRLRRVAGHTPISLSGTPIASGLERSSAHLGRRLSCRRRTSRHPGSRTRMPAGQSRNASYDLSGQLVDQVDAMLHSPCHRQRASSTTEVAGGSGAWRLPRR
jgi:hypothetical protein